MTSLEFREKHHAEFAELLQLPIMQQALIAIMMERPRANSNQCRDKTGKGDPSLFASQLGKIDGYETCYATLRTLAVKPPPQKTAAGVPMNYQQKQPAGASPATGGGQEMAPDPDQHNPKNEG